MSVSEIVLVWPVQVPLRIPGGYAATVERERTQKGDYPPEWPGVAWLVKTIAGWKCERCTRPHSGTMLDGFGLTVHHLDKNKANLQHWNLAALCQRCHLKIEHRVDWYQVWMFEHSRWMAVHVADYNEWAIARRCTRCKGTGSVDKWGPLSDGRQHFLGTGWLCPDCNGEGNPPLLPLGEIVDRDYSQEWA